MKAKTLQDVLKIIRESELTYEEAHELEIKVVEYYLVEMGGNK